MAQKCSTHKGDSSLSLRSISGMLELVFASTTLAGAGLPPSVLDAQACPDDAAAYLAVEPPGAGPVSLVAALDVDRLSADAQVDALVAIERQIGWLQGLQQRVLAAIDARVQATAPRPTGRVRRTWRERRSAVRCIWPGRPRRAGWRSPGSWDRLPATLQALQDGRDHLLARPCPGRGRRSYGRGRCRADRGERAA